MSEKFIIHAAPKIGFKKATTIAVDKSDFEWFDGLKDYSGLNSPTLFHMMCAFCADRLDMREDERQDTALGLSLSDTLERINGTLAAIGARLGEER